MSTHVIFDKNAGLCPGVKRTIQDALKVSKIENNIVSYGELIHNPFVVSRLRANGISVANDLSKIEKDRFVIIRAHGIPPSEEKYLEEQGIRYMDLTCPRVKSVHKRIAEYKSLGYTIIIVGHSSHPETIGHIGYAGEKGVIVSSIKEAEKADTRGKCVMIAQTTISDSLFDEIFDFLSARNNSIERINTICSFTAERQKWIDRFSKKTGFSIVIGGKKSSNTGILYEIALVNGKAAWIEEPGEIANLNISDYDSIAVTGGTSTPKEVFEETVDYFKVMGASIEFI